MSQTAEIAGPQRALMMVPQQWHAGYTEDDRNAVAGIIHWLNNTGKSQSQLVRLAGVNKGTASQVLSGIYTSPPTKFLKAMQAAMRTYDERRSKREIPFVETSMAQLARAVCHRARLYKNFGVLIGYVGTGKTKALRRIADDTPATYLIEADPDMNPGSLMSDLMEATHATIGKGARGRSGGSTLDKFRAVEAQLRGTDALIIVDDPERIQPRCLHYLRRLRDKAGIGIVLSGAPDLAGLLAGGHFDQVRSRVGFWPETVTRVTRGDTDQVMQAAFDEELPEEVLDEVWIYCDGSMRVLAEQLIPAIRDYGTGKGHKLTPRLVKEIATKMLSLRAAKAAPRSEAQTFEAAA